MVLAACSKEPQQREPEVEHCATLAGIATESYGQITIVRVRYNDLENVRSVQLRFEYPPEYTEFKVGNIACGYAFDLRTRADKNRIINAQSVYFRGRALSASELNYLNTSPFRPRPKFKVIP